MRSATVNAGGKLTLIADNTANDTTDTVTVSMKGMKNYTDTVPDPVGEYEKSLHDSFYSYLSDVIVPSMIICAAVLYIVNAGRKCTA